MLQYMWVRVGHTVSERTWCTWCSSLYVFLFENSFICLFLPLCPEALPWGKSVPAEEAEALLPPAGAKYSVGTLCSLQGQLFLTVCVISGTPSHNSENFSSTVFFNVFANSYYLFKFNLKELKKENRTNTLSKSIKICNNYKKLHDFLHCETRKVFLIKDKEN